MEIHRKIKARFNNILHKRINKEEDKKILKRGKQILNRITK